MKPNEKLSIFLVEDNEMYALMIDHKLKNLANYRLKTFSTAEECIKNLYQNPDIIFVDYMLPGINGIEALKVIKETNKNTNVVLLSGQDDIQVALDATRYGAMDYIIKNKDSIHKIFECIGEAFKQQEYEQSHFSLSLNLNKEKTSFYLIGGLIIAAFGILIILLNN